MLNTYNITSQTVAVNGSVIFSNNLYQTGCSTVHNVGTDIIEVRCPGTYLLTFNGSGAATAAATDPITLQLFRDNSPVPGASASVLSTSTTDEVNLAFSTILQVRPSCPSISNVSSLTVKNIGVEAEFDNANLTIFKISC